MRATSPPQKKWLESSTNGPEESRGSHHLTSTTRMANDNLPGESVRRRFLPRQSQFRRDAPHSLDAEGDVFVEVDAHLGSAVDDVVTADGAGEGFVLHFFPDGLGFNLRQRLVGFHQRGGGDESGELVASEQRLLKHALTRDSAVVGMRQDGAANVFGIAAIFQDLAAFERMVLGGRIFFVIEVVDESDQTPEVFVFAELASVSAEANFHRKGVFAKTF